MNRTVFAVREDESVETALQYFIELEISAAPVVDGRAAPVGVVAWRDLLATERTEPIGNVMRTPAVSVSRDTPIERAAVELDQHGIHHLVVVAPSGHVAGFVSSLDLVRGMLGRPAPHPRMFPQYREGSSLAWTSLVELTGEAIDEVEHGAGILAISLDDGTPSPGPLWSEAVADLPKRLHEILNRSIDLPAGVRDLPAREILFFSTAPFSTPGPRRNGERQPSLRDLLTTAGSSPFLIGDDSTA